MGRDHSNTHLPPLQAAAAAAKSGGEDDFLQVKNRGRGEKKKRRRSAVVTLHLKGGEAEQRAFTKHETTSVSSPFVNERSKPITFNFSYNLDHS